MDMKHVKYLALVLCIGNLSPVMAQTASEPDPIFYKNSDFTNYTMRISGNLLCPTDETFGRRCPVPAIGLFDNALPFSGYSSIRSGSGRPAGYRSAVLWPGI